MLLREVAPRMHLRVQGPLVLSERSAPQPDVIVLQPRADTYYASHPVAADALLIVEVADTTLEYDLEIKRLLYAQAGVVELWVVDINRREVHVFREPEFDYTIHTILTKHEYAAVAVLGGVGFPVAALFPNE